MKLRRACPECGRRFRGDARFCGDCGAALPVAARPSPAARTWAQTPSGILAGAVVLAGIVIAGVTSAADLEDGGTTKPPPADGTGTSAAGEDAEDGEGIAVRPADGAGGTTPDPGSVVWRRDIATTSLVSAGAATLYIQTGEGISAVDRATGALRWHAQHVPGTPLDPLPAGIPVVGDDGVLRVLQATDGTMRWSVEGLRLSAPNAVTAGAFVITVEEDGLVSYAAGGRPAWRLDGIDPRWFGQPGAGRGLLFVVSPASLLAIHPLTGALAWRSELAGLTGPVTVVRDTVVVRDDDGRLHGLALRSGELRWSRSNATGTAVVAEDVVAVRAAPGGDRAELVQAETGRSLGTLPSTDGILDLIEFGDEIVVVGQDRLAAFRASGELSWELELGVPVRQLLTGGELWLAVTEREVLALVPAQRGTSS